MLELEINNFNDYQKLYDYIFDGKSSKIILFNGNLGSGKTTLIQLICNKLKVKEKVLSPTFNLMNEYTIDNSLKVYHFDFYRIKSSEALVDIDFFEYLYSGNYCFIEWPNICKNLIKDDYLEIFIDIVADNKRLIKIS
tara:strand:- start:5227 stop:5640 length:414 start_codon:yes stop_codon:yes gene_type:complete